MVQNRLVRPNNLKQKKNNEHKHKVTSLKNKSKSKTLKKYDKFGDIKFISHKKSSSYSTPNRLIIVFEGLQKKIILKRNLAKRIFLMI